MQFGYASISEFTFIAAGFWVVIAVAFGLGLVYVVGATRGKRAAQLWVDLCVGALAVGTIADLAWAVGSGQWARFMREFGFSSLVELLVLAFLLLFTMWFMAVQYVRGLKE